MKKVVVLFPYPGSETLGQKTFEINTEKGYLEANNTEQGNLIILEKTETASRGTCQTLAVFKDWIYWEQIREAND